MKISLIFLFMLFSINNLTAQNEIVNLWKTIPNSKETTEIEIVFIKF